jgi:hypothetical protein
MNPQPKRHHFVPEMLQKRFVADDGRLFYFDKSAPDKGVRSTGSGNLLLQGHLYSITNPDGTKDVSLELNYSRLEAAADPIIARLVESVLEKKLPILSQRDKQVICFFLYQQWRRTPDFLDSIVPPSQMGALLEETIQEYETKFNKVVSAEKRNEMMLPDKLKEFRQYARVRSLRSASKDVLKLIEGKGICFGVATRRQSFILGGNPVLKIVNGDDPHLGNLGVEVWLPIHPQVMLAAAGKVGEEKIVELPSRSVRFYNEAIVKKSRLFVGRSRELIRSLSRKF